MSREMRYLAYAVEYYRNAKGLTGAQLERLFTKHGVCQLILDNYFLYHIESPDLMVADVDCFIRTGRVLDA